MKKTLSVILALVLAFGMMLTAFASVITSLNMTAVSALPKAGEALPTINPMGNSQWFMAAADAAFYKNNAVFTGVPEEGDVIELRADVHGHNGGAFPADLSPVTAVWNGIQATNKVPVGSNVVRFTFPYEIPLSTLTVEGLYPPQKGDPALDLSCSVSVGGKSYPALSVEYQYLTYEGLGGEPKYVGFITPDKLNTLSTVRVEIIVDLPAQVSSKIVDPVGVWGDAKFSGVSKNGNRYTIWFSLQDFTNTK
ncbi:MAG: hypothetical protein IJL26_05365, partial [Clostridia bacterium]|nr:hypothetical protein [Clostridia bacterium]